MAVYKQLPAKTPNMASPLADGLKLFSVLDSLSPRNLVQGSSDNGVSVNGPLLKYDLYGPCLEFDRTTDNHVIFGNAPAIGNNSDFTAMALFNIGTPPTSTSADIFGNFNLDGWGLNYSNFPGVEGFRLIAGNGSSIAGLFNVAGGLSYSNKWVVVAVAFNIVEQKLKLYIDGVLQFSVSTGGGYNTASTRSLYLGGLEGGGNGVTGRIAWFAAFDKELPASAIALWSSGDIEELFDDPMDLVVLSGDSNDILTFTETYTGRIGVVRASTDAVSFSESNVSSHGANSKDVLSFVEINTTQKDVFRRQVDVLGFNESDGRSKDVGRKSSDVLTFNDKFYGVNVYRTKTDTLTFSEGNTTNKIRGRNHIDVLSFVEGNTTNKIIIRGTDDNLDLKESKFVQLGNTVLFVPGYIATITSASQKNVLQGKNRSIVLPTPIFGDTEANGDILKSLFRTETGRRVITIQRKIVKTLKYTFNVTRRKGIEFQEFIRSEIDNEITWRNWKGEIWVGKIGTNPFNSTVQGRWGPCTEKIQVDLELQAVRIH